MSYPSSDDEDEELADEATNSQNIPREKPFSPTNFNTILMPTQATMQEKKSHRRYASNSSNKIDFSFFESDTSPFDHLEMKSMNEMEVLAQVLGSTPVEAATFERENSSESESSDQKDNNNVAAPQEPQQVVQQFQQNFAPYSNYYAAPNSSYYNYHNNYGQVNHQQNQFLYPQQNYAVNYQYAAAPNNNNIIENGTDEKMDVGSKSKSVPSILKELNDELNNSQRRRIRNNSQNSPKEVTEGKLRKFVSSCLTLEHTLGSCTTNRHFLVHNITRTRTLKLKMTQEFVFPNYDTILLQHNRRQLKMISANFR